MPILISDIRSKLDEPRECILERAISKLKIGRSLVKKAEISKTSIDARKGKISLVSSVLLELNVDEESMVKLIGDPHVVFKCDEPLLIAYGTEKTKAPIVVAGFGPAGMFAALLLSEHGYRVVVLERGEQIEERTASVKRFWAEGLLNPECNVQFGEGGAGTFSDGKLTTRIGDARCGYVLKRFVEFGAPNEILTKAKPHIGTDYLKDVVCNIRKRIIENGGQIRFNSKLTEFCKKCTRYAYFTAGKRRKTGSCGLNFSDWTQRKRYLWFAGRKRICDDAETLFCRSAYRTSTIRGGSRPLS